MCLLIHRVNLTITVQYMLKIRDVERYTPMDCIYVVILHNLICPYMQL
jgi:hypothetical protein